MSKAKRFWSDRRRNVRVTFAAAVAGALLVAAGWAWFSSGGFDSGKLPALATSELEPVRILSTTREGAASAIDPDQLAYAWAMTLNESDSDNNFEAVDAVDVGYTNVLFTEDLWIMDAILDLEEVPTSGAEPIDPESHGGGIEGSEKSSPAKRLGDF